jgi:hypothetical protein
VPVAQSLRRPQRNSTPQLRAAAKQIVSIVETRVPAEQSSTAAAVADSRKEPANIASSSDMPSVFFTDTNSHKLQLFTHVCRCPCQDLLWYLQ